MKPDESEAAKQSWEPMKVSCVGHIGEVVEASPKIAVQQATPPEDPGDILDLVN